MPSELAERINGRRRDIGRISTRLDAGYPNLGVAPSGPMDQQHRLVGGVVEIADDLLDQDMDETLFGPCISRRGVPRRRQVVRKLKEACTIDLWPRRRIGTQVVDSTFEFGDALQGAVPARLQLAGDMALGGIHQFVSAPGEGGFISRSFEFPLDRGDDVLLRALDLIGSEDRGLHRTIGDSLEDLQGNRAIDPNTTDADAQPCTDMSVIAAALVAMGIAFAHAVEDAHHPSTASTPHQTGEQCTSAARRLACAILLHMRILEQKLLIVLIFLPTDVAR